MNKKIKFLIPLLAVPLLLAACNNDSNNKDTEKVSSEESVDKKNNSEIKALQNEILPQLLFSRNTFESVNYQFHSKSDNKVYFLTTKANESKEGYEFIFVGVLNKANNNEEYIFIKDGNYYYQDVARQYFDKKLNMDNPLVDQDVQKYLSPIYDFISEVDLSLNQFDLRQLLEDDKNKYILKFGEDADKFYQDAVFKLNSSKKLTSIELQGDKLNILEYSTDIRVPEDFKELTNYYK